MAPDEPPIGEDPQLAARYRGMPTPPPPTQQTGEDDTEPTPTAREWLHGMLSWVKSVAPQLPSVAEDEELGGGAARSLSPSLMRGGASVPSIDDMLPEGVVAVLTNVRAADPGAAGTALQCFSRIRVLCARVENQAVFEGLGAAALLVKVINTICNGKANELLTPRSATAVVLHGLSALVNLVCERECMERRDSSCNAGGLRVAVAALNGTLANIDVVGGDEGLWFDVTEMSASLILNLCYGDDEHVLARRERAAKDGAVVALVRAIKRTKSETCVKALRVVVDRMPESRAIAAGEGVEEAWVKPLRQTRGQMKSREGGGEQQPPTQQTSSTPPASSYRRRMSATSTSIKGALMSFRDAMSPDAIKENLKESLIPYRRRNSPGEVKTGGLEADAAATRKA